MDNNTLTIIITVVVILVLGLLIAWFFSRRQSQEPEKEAAPGPSPQVSSEETTPDLDVQPKEPPRPDDLKRIEGIGPKISGILQAAGITTFAQLAASDVGRLGQILEDAGLGALANPDTWPEQAGLAAAGKWDELEVLQDELKGGKRT
jgi:predicted flap endonuclease-1-like 5' DNA nuclease